MLLWAHLNLKLLICLSDYFFLLPQKGASYHSVAFHLSLSVWHTVHTGRQELRTPFSFSYKETKAKNNPVRSSSRSNSMSTWSEVLPTILVLAFEAIILRTTKKKKKIYWVQLYSKSHLVFIFDYFIFCWNQEGLGNHWGTGCFIPSLRESMCAILLVDTNYMIMFGLVLFFSTRFSEKDFNLDVCQNSYYFKHVGVEGKQLFNVLHRQSTVIQHVGYYFSF